jgi:phytoene dehydrogenase-like protein
VTKIEVDGGRVTGVRAQHGRHARHGDFLPCDFLIGNLTPWSLDALLADDSPLSLKREVRSRPPTWGAFMLYAGVKASALPAGLPDHHQFIAEMDGLLGEGRSIFLSLSPQWDDSRAPIGFRAATISTHTDVGPWWDALAQGREVYEARKAEYAERILTTIERTLPGFRTGIGLLMPGTPVTFEFYTSRHRGMVGGFPQTSLLRVRGPRAGIPNLRMVGDSIFPGQSTAGVTLGALRVADDVLRALPSARDVHFLTQGRKGARTQWQE